jgi:6-phosphogluconolactonase
MLKIVDTVADLALTGAQLFARLAKKAQADHGMFRVALSGGTTPRRLYETLAKPPFVTGVDWSRVCLFWGDERHVPHDAPQSNFGMAKLAFLGAVSVPPEQVFPIPYLSTAEASARAYEKTLRTIWSEDVPCFDLLFLGLGGDGHTASLFPGSKALDETARWACPSQPLAGGAERVTLTYPVLNNAAAICFLVAGADKAAIVERVMTGTKEGTPLPAERLQPARDRLVWLLDRAAAARVGPI